MANHGLLMDEHHALHHYYGASDWTGFRPRPVLRVVWLIVARPSVNAEAGGNRMGSLLVDPSNSHSNGFQPRQRRLLIPVNILVEANQR
jgi:hypothetical protein